jgi:hypothetical protein
MARSPALPRLLFLLLLLRLSRRGAAAKGNGRARCLLDGQVEDDGGDEPVVQEEKREGGRGVGASLSNRVVEQGVGYGREGVVDDGSRTRSSPLRTFPLEPALASRSWMLMPLCHAFTDGLAVPHRRLGL